MKSVIENIEIVHLREGGINVNVIDDLWTFHGPAQYLVTYLFGIPIHKCRMHEWEKTYREIMEWYAVVKITRY